MANHDDFKCRKFVDENINSRFPTMINLILGICRVERGEDPMRGIWESQT